MSGEFKNIPYPEFFVDESIIQENDRVMSRSGISFDNKMERIDTGNELFEAEDYYNSSEASNLGNKKAGSKNFDNKTSEGYLSNDKDSAPKNKKKLIIAIVAIVVLLLIAVPLIIVYAPSSDATNTNQGGDKVDEKGPKESKVHDKTIDDRGIKRREGLDPEGADKHKKPQVPDPKIDKAGKGDSSETGDPKKPETTDPKKPGDPEHKGGEKRVKPDVTLVRKHKYVLKQDPASFNLDLESALAPTTDGNLYDQDPKNQIKPDDIYDTKRDKFIYTKTYGNNFVQTKPFDFKFIEMSFAAINSTIKKVVKSFNSAYYYSSDKNNQINKVVYYDGSVLIENTDKLEYLTIWEESFPKLRLVTLIATPNAAGGINKQDRDRAYIQFKVTGEVKAIQTPIVSQDAMNNVSLLLSSIFK